MPISLELVNFTEAFRIRHVKTIAESFERLGKWLTQRVKQADELERATNRIPVVWFYNESVTLWIDASQKDTLAPKEPPPSFSDHLKAGGDRFVAGLKDVVELPRESLIIPRFFNPVLAGVDEIVKSVERFHKPTKSMFDKEARTASDLFGEAALAFRALYWSKDQIWDVWRTLKKLKGPEKPGGAVASADALPDLFERVTRYVVAGLSLVPLLPEFVKRVWKEASIFIRAKVLDVFAGIEEQVFGVRRKVIDIFYVDLRESLRKGLTFALAWHFIATAWVALFLEVSERFGKQIFEQVGDYFDKLSEFIKKLVGVFHGLEALLNDLTKIDLMPPLIGSLGGKGAAAKFLASPPQLLIGDLAEPDTRASANVRLQEWLDKILQRVADVGVGIPLITVGVYFYLRSELKPVRELLNITLTTQTQVPEETSAFAGPLPGFPDISDAFTTWIIPFRESLADFVPSLQTQTKGLIDKATEALDAIGTHFDRAAASAWRGPSVERYLAISGAAVQMAEKAFPSSDVVGGEPDAVVGAFARSWESWFVRGEQGAHAGFDMIGAILPEYIAAMREYWAERQARGEEATVRLPEELPQDFPTSPHIMALRPVLAHTLVPCVTIDATGYMLDEELTQRVADAFLDRVQEAHSQGLAKLASIQVAAGV